MSQPRSSPCRPTVGCAAPPRRLPRFTGADFHHGRYDLRLTRHRYGLSVAAERGDGSIMGFFEFDFNRRIAPSRLSLSTGAGNLWSARRPASR